MPRFDLSSIGRDILSSSTSLSSSSHTARSSSSSSSFRDTSISPLASQHVPSTSIFKSKPWKRIPSNGVSGSFTSRSTSGGSGSNLLDDEDEEDEKTSQERQEIVRMVRKEK